MTRRVICVLNYSCSFIFGKMRKALLQLHIAVFLAGFTAILGQLIKLNEGLLVWYRLLITVITLAVILVIQKEFIFIPWKQFLRVLGVGAIVAIHWVTFYGSVKYGNISIALVCFSASGFFTALFEPLILRRRLSLIELMLGLLAIAGIYVIFDFNPQFKTGIIFGIISAMGSAVFPIFNKNLLNSISPRVLTFYELGGGLITLTFLVPLYLMLFPAKYYLPTTSDWAWLMILAWFCTVLSFVLQLNALKKISAFTASLTYNLEPVYGIIMAFVFFHENEKLNWSFYFGVGLILLAVIIQMIRVRNSYRKAGFGHNS